MSFFGKKIPKYTKEELLEMIRNKKDEIITTAAKAEDSSRISGSTLLSIALAIVTGASAIGMTIRGAESDPKKVNENSKVVDEYDREQEESNKDEEENIDKYSEVRGSKEFISENEYYKLKKDGYVKIGTYEVPEEELEVYVPYVLNADANIRRNPEVSRGNESNVLSTEKAGEIIYMYDKDTTEYNFDDEYNWKKVATCTRDLWSSKEGYIAIPDNARKLTDDEIVDLDVKCIVKVKDAPETELESEILQANQEAVYEVPTNPNRTDCTESSEIVIDMLNCGDFEGFKTLVDSGKVSACIFSVETTDENADFYQLFYDDDPAEYNEYIGTENESKLMHKNLAEIEQKYNANKLPTEQAYGSEKITRENTPGYVNGRNLKNLEQYVSYAMSKGVKVGFYFYTLAINNNQASAEAAYIHALYKKLEQDIPGFNKKGVKLPIIVDVEYGSWRDGAYNEQRTDAIEQVVKLLGKGTDAEGTWAIDGVDPKKGYGIIDKNFTLYIGINEMYNYINPDRFKKDMTDAGYGIYNWYTRHTDRLPVSYNNGFDYSYLMDANSMIDGILNNQSCINHYPLVDEAAYLQCDLQQIFANSDYDFSIAPKGNMEKIANGEKITKFVGDLRNERAVNPQAQDQNQAQDRDDEER